jgi:hypothetical protein
MAGAPRIRRGLVYDRDMRGPLSAISAAACASVLSTTAAGCTFFVSFDDLPDIEGDASPSPQPGADARDRITPGFDAGPVGSDGDPRCNPGFSLDEIRGCTGQPEGRALCAEREVIAYPADRDESGGLVTCSGGRAVCATRCAGACEQNSAGDRCGGGASGGDGCDGKATGDYCGWELDDPSRDLLVTCSGGRRTAATQCGGTCIRTGESGRSTCA